MKASIKKTKEQYAAQVEEHNARLAEQHQAELNVVIDTYLKDPKPSTAGNWPEVADPSGMAMMMMDDEVRKQAIECMSLCPFACRFCTFACVAAPHTHPGPGGPDQDPPEPVLRILAVLPLGVACVHHHHACSLSPFTHSYAWSCACL